jgi:hypothetical protein
MGIFDLFMGIQEPVEGEYRITSATRPPTSSSVAGCDMIGEVSGPGVPARTIEHNSPFTSVDKWPRPGDVLPVLFDRDNPVFLKIQWKQVPDRSE